VDKYCTSDLNQNLELYKFAVKTAQFTIRMARVMLHGCYSILNVDLTASFCCGLRLVG